MTDAAELMALMTPHGVQVGKPFGGVPSLTALDIAGAMGMGLDKFHAHLLMAKYCLDAGAYSSAWPDWLAVVARRAGRQKWDLGKPGTIRRLARYTLDDWISPGRCRRCHGAAILIERGKTVPTAVCPACEGTGNAPRSGRREAAALGYSASGYRLTPWPDRVARCRQDLIRREGWALRAVSRGLRGV